MRSSAWSIARSSRVKHVFAARELLGGLDNALQSVAVNAA